MDTNILKQLQEWYAQQCDGDWEYLHGIKITTIDRPGLKVKINVSDTELEDKPFDPISRKKSNDDWLQCSVINQSFEGYGGQRNLIEILQIFINWTKT
ncbi:Uncharacterized protein PHSC3_001640 [Chlamydiales bacterium STE3]|nr:Uncharacterized protein PHSC3_001640 [Chlamydiales bacterium STE3]